MLDATIASSCWAAPRDDPSLAFTRADQSTAEGAARRQRVSTTRTPARSDRFNPNRPVQMEPVSRSRRLSPAAQRQLTAQRHRPRLTRSFSKGWGTDSIGHLRMKPIWHRLCKEGYRWSLVDSAMSCHNSENLGQFMQTKRARANSALIGNPSGQFVNNLRRKPDGSRHVYED